MEYKRRNLSGIYIFDTFPTDETRKPTCIEDCQQETRREYCMSCTPDALRDAISHLGETFKNLTNYLVDEGCVNDAQRTGMFKMIDYNLNRSTLNWSKHELAEQVDFMCMKLRLLSDACGVSSI